MNDDRKNVIETKPDFYQSVADILHAARAKAYRAVNFAMVEAYWNIGRMIVEEEQRGQKRAEYGATLIKNLSSRLTAEFGKGFTETNLRYFRQFYLAFPAKTGVEIHHTLCDKLTWSHYRLLTETKDFFIDLVFYNYLLKCFILIDLKAGELTHQDIGQMDMYVRLFEDTIKSEDDNPTVGLILCTEKDHTIVKYSVLEESKRLFAARYQLYLPTEQELIEEIEREKHHVIRELAVRYG